MGSQNGEQFFMSEITADRASRKRAPDTFVVEPAREVPVLFDVDVLVVGGGPAGTAAAVAAGRSGARVLLVERYNHLGGLSTGGLVIWIDRMTDWAGNRVIGGIGGEMMDRLPSDAILGPSPTEWGSREAAAVGKWRPRHSAFHDIVTWAPMIDPEALKQLSLDMVREAGAEILFHSWASTPIVGATGLEGIIFESKQGRFAAKAKVVIDTTGDGDIFAAAGEQSASDIEESSIQQCINTAWLFAGTDNERWLAFKASDGYDDFVAAGRAAVGQLEPPGPAWRNDVAVFMGPRWAGYDGLDVRDLTEVELRSRDKMVELLAWYRKHAPGFENAWIALSAPQIGIRQTRRLVGRARMTRDDWRIGVVHDDEVGISPSLAPKFDSVSVPFRSLLPQKTDRLIVAGRHLSADASSQSFMREIPQCWLTGHAAGVAAAKAVDQGVPVGELSIADVQQALRGQGAILRDKAARPVKSETAA
ncbi:MULTISPECIES: FAD-dependent oxidoreductase [Sphingobium]|uniref:FAD-dependent oxidoreductase n=1 Tax=Sphingobium TaxID=165695 RepID=UPI00159C6EA1|nr:FAD-dependent oxidoreductase [Sphingobium sp. 15-1]